MYVYRSARGLSIAGSVAIATGVVSELLQKALVAGMTPEQLLASPLLLAAPSVFGISGIVLWLMWMVRTAQNARAFHPTAPFEHTVAESVWCWFIPFVNWVRPHAIAAEVWHASSDPLESKAEQRTPLLITGWWVTYILCFFGVLLEAFGGVPYVGSLWRVASGVFCLLVMRDLTRRQDETFARRTQAGPRFADGLRHVTTASAPPV